MSNNDKLDLGNGAGALVPRGLAASVPGGNAGTCANLSCRQFSSALVSGYCPICASGRGPAPITGGKTVIPGGSGHGFHLTAPAGKCEGGVCAVGGGDSSKCSGDCGGKCGGDCACQK